MYAFQIYIQVSSFNLIILLQDANKTVLPIWKDVLNGRGCLNINNQTNLAKNVCDEGVIFLENRVVMSTVIKRYNLSCAVTFSPTKYFVKANSFILLKSFQEKKLINSM